MQKLQSAQGQSAKAPLKLVGAEKSTRNTVAKIAAKQVAMESDWESEEFRSDSRWLEFQKHLQKIERDL